MLKNPLRYVDPTGHSSQQAMFAGEADFTGNLLFGITFKNGSKKWTLKGIMAVMEAVGAAGKRYAEITRGRAADAFRAVHNTSTTNPLVFEIGCPDCTASGETINSHHIKINEFYSTSYMDKALRDRNLITHELGHAFNAQMVNNLGKSFSPYEVLNRRQSIDPIFPDRGAAEGYPYGFASESGVYTWQQSTDPYYGEEFADQFLGWVFDEWQDHPDGITRSTFMDAYMYLWVSTTGH